MNQWLHFFLLLVSLIAMVISHAQPPLPLPVVLRGIRPVYILPRRALPSNSRVGIPGESFAKLKPQHHPPAAAAARLGLTTSLETSGFPNLELEGGFANRQGHVPVGEYEHEDDAPDQLAHHHRRHGGGGSKKKRVPGGRKVVMGRMMLPFRTYRKTPQVHHHHYEYYYPQKQEKQHHKHWDIEHLKEIFKNLCPHKHEFLQKIKKNYQNYINTKSKIMKRILGDFLQEKEEAEKKDEFDYEFDI